MGMLPGNVWGKVMKEKGCFNRVLFVCFCIDLFWQRFPVSNVKNVLWYREWTCLMG